MNQIYNVLDPTSKTVQQSKVVTIGKNDIITMNSSEVHGTVSIGKEATFHLHLYGCSLVSLPPFSDRIYTVVPVTKDGQLLIIENFDFDEYYEQSVELEISSSDTNLTKSSSETTVDVAHICLLVICSTSDLSLIHI